VLHEVVGAEAALVAREATDDASDDRADEHVSDTEADEMEEHLRGLGYIE
jgi:hypothetical protein